MTFSVRGRLFAGFYTGLCAQEAEMYHSVFWHEGSGIQAVEQWGDQQQL